MEKNLALYKLLHRKTTALNWGWDTKCIASNWRGTFFAINSDILQIVIKIFKAK